MINISKRKTRKLLHIIITIAVIISGNLCINRYNETHDKASILEMEDSSVSVSKNNTSSSTNYPIYAGKAYIVVNENIPQFNEKDLTRTDPFEEYSDLDSMGRCGTAYANICIDLMPCEDRESISEIKPSGWNNRQYDFIDGGYIYNRCHLIGFQLAGENANERNLITGTRYLNIEGMLPFENMVADYVRETRNHVLYRVTPLYSGENLVADGVQMEGYSVEDQGSGISYNVFCYNVQPGCVINYADGFNWEDK